METATNAHPLASAPRSPRKASSVLLAGLACLLLLLLGGLYFISSLKPSAPVSSLVESTAAPSAVPDTSTISPFPRLDNLAGHAMFAPLATPASDSLPKVLAPQK
ncbi:hypothetical protein GU926_11380 [Nibribacter ruber]|uniref:Uncharacterized protein n=1 Tax=Nibribacter ruber TaxID=2698458 RepID=A0A6P1NVY6_9BACT|nr:hypothetical protein [Nibribacter ruber]QHL87996.1 hypothetical protein GU926_11380 [Nibribacter ruber]